MTTREKINYSLGIARGGRKIEISFPIAEVDDQEAIAEEYRQSGRDVVVSQDDDKTTFVFSQTDG